MPLNSITRYAFQKLRHVLDTALQVDNNFVSSLTNEKLRQRLMKKSYNSERVQCLYENLDLLSDDDNLYTALYSSQQDHIALLLNRTTIIGGTIGKAEIDRVVVGPFIDRSILAGNKLEHLRDNRQHYVKMLTKIPRMMREVKNHKLVSHEMLKELKRIKRRLKNDDTKDLELADYVVSFIITTRNPNAFNMLCLCQKKFRLSGPSDTTS